MSRRRPTIKRIHVDQHAIKRNIHAEVTEPVLTIQNRGKSRKARTIRIQGPTDVVYRPNKPLACGARCWIETTAPVLVDGEEYIV